MVTPPLIKPDSYADILRRKSFIQPNKFLLTKFSRSLQEKDISEGVNCDGFGRVHLFRSNSNPNWIPNPLPQQIAAWRLGLDIPDVERAQVFQNAACNFRCWYCFVDFELLSASTRRSIFLSSDEIIATFLRETNRARVIDLSGGQPDIVPEWTICIMKSLKRQSLESDFFLWIDDNLSLDYSWKYLSESDFNLMREYRNFGRVGCFKGFSEESFQENTLVSGKLLSRQIEIMSRWVKTGLDMYGYITLTISNLSGMRGALRRFMDDVQDKIGQYFLLRTIPLEILPYSPTKTRLNASREKALTNQYEVLNAWKDELHSRYSSLERSRPIYEQPLMEG